MLNDLNGTRNKTNETTFIPVHSYDDENIVNFRRRKKFKFGIQSVLDFIVVNMWGISITWIHIRQNKYLFNTINYDYAKDSMSNVERLKWKKHASNEITLFFHFKNVIISNVGFAPTFLFGSTEKPFLNNVFFFAFVTEWGFVRYSVRWLFLFHPRSTASSQQNTKNNKIIFIERKKKKAFLFRKIETWERK